MAHLVDPHGPYTIWHISEFRRQPSALHSGQHSLPGDVAHRLGVRFGLGNRYRTIVVFRLVCIVFYFKLDFHSAIYLYFKVIYACVTSQGGLVNSFFSWSVWIPLSRLTFSAYLFHTTIIYGYYDSLEHSIHAQYSTMIYIYLGHITIAYAGAYLVALVCEVPILGLEKFIFKRH